MTDNTGKLSGELLGDLEPRDVTAEDAAAIRGGEAMAGESGLLSILGKAVDAVVKTVGDGLNQAARK